MLDEDFQDLLTNHFIFELGRLRYGVAASEAILEYYKQPGHMLQYLLSG